MLTNLKKIGVSAMLFAPYVAFGAASDISSFLTQVEGWIGVITSIVVALVFIYFIWGLIKYLTAGSEGKDEAKAQMLYSVLIMFVIFSIWGIIRLLGGFLGITGNEGPINVQVPTVI